MKILSIFTIGLLVTSAPAFGMDVAVKAAQAAQYKQTKARYVTTYILPKVLSRFDNSTGAHENEFRKFRNFAQSWQTKDTTNMSKREVRRLNAFIHAVEDAVAASVAANIVKKAHARAQTAEEQAAIRECWRRNPLSAGIGTEEAAIQTFICAALFEEHNPLMEAAAKAVSENSQSSFNAAMEVFLAQVKTTGVAAENRAAATKGDEGKDSAEPKRAEEKREVVAAALQAAAAPAPVMEVHKREPEKAKRAEGEMPESIEKYFKEQLIAGKLTPVSFRHLELVFASVARGDQKIKKDDESQVIEFALFSALSQFEYKDPRWQKIVDTLKAYAQNWQSLTADKLTVAEKARYDAFLANIAECRRISHIAHQVSKGNDPSEEKHIRYTFTDLYRVKSDALYRMGYDLFMLAGLQQLDGAVFEPGNAELQKKDYAARVMEAILPEALDGFDNSKGSWNIVLDKFKDFAHRWQDQDMSALSNIEKIRYETFVTALKEAERARCNAQVLLAGQTKDMDHDAVVINFIRELQVAATLRIAVEAFKVAALPESDELNDAGTTSWKDGSKVSFAAAAKVFSEQVQKFEADENQAQAN